jgi:energy-coupling factor transport system ATP-binding protein
MAGALMLEPRLLVVDEPLANLDPATAARLLRLLRELAGAGHAVVIVEHRVEDALVLSPDKVLYLEHGEARYLGQVAGFLQAVDPEAVRLPFEVLLERERARERGSLQPALRPQLPVDDPTGPPRLSFRDITVDLGDRTVLSGLTATFGAREVVAVLGPNGSGKTTLLRTGMGLVRPKSGTIEVDGSSTRGHTVADLARVFGYVFQSPSQMLFCRTVRDELLFGPKNLGHPVGDADSFCMRVLQRIFLDTEEGILDRPPMTLSFGQQKRLALAIALALEPPTLVLDEPSAGQDHRTANAFLDEVMSIAGLESVYLVTHDVDLALTRADRILLLRQGGVVADGPPARVIEDEERWLACNLQITSLMRANRAWQPSASRLMDATTLARHIISHEGGPPSRERDPVAQQEGTMEERLG